MPTYDYRCDACGHAFELFQSMAESPKRTCPACKKSALRRLIGAGAAIVFKGSGFYQTDYRSESYKQAAKADTSGAAPVAAEGAKAKPAEAASSPQPSASKADARPAAESRSKGTTTSTPKPAPTSQPASSERKRRARPSRS